jgi:hypothetical protein
MSEISPKAAATLVDRIAGPEPALVANLVEASRARFNGRMPTTLTRRREGEETGAVDQEE